MPANLPPLPWHHEPEPSGFINIVDANGKRIATVWNDVFSKEAVADLIIEASKVADKQKSGGGLVP